MKILIISLPRTGSTSLMKLTAKKHNLNYIHEPFNKIFYEKYKNYDWISNDNYVIKSIIDQLPEGETDIISYWEKFHKNFDKIILLSRKDLVDCSKSLAYAAYHTEKAYWSNKYIWELTPNLEETYRYIIFLNKLMFDIKNRLNLDIIYYEDIFDINSDERLRINKNIKKKLL
jgi:hypothetical protein